MIDNTRMATMQQAQQMHDVGNVARGFRPLRENVGHRMLMRRAALGRNQRQQRISGIAGRPR